MRTLSKRGEASMQVSGASPPSGALIAGTELEEAFVAADGGGVARHRTR